MKTSIACLMGALLLAASPAQAGWHTGTVTALKFGYDGASVMFTISGLSRTDCTCYSAWTSDLCLDAGRDTHKAEIAFLMSARARGTAVSVNIDEATCRVVAMYEAG